jgi:hypothetical protein
MFPCYIIFVSPFEFFRTGGAYEEAPTRMDEDVIEN